MIDMNGFQDTIGALDGNGTVDVTSAGTCCSFDSGRVE